MTEALAVSNSMLALITVLTLYGAVAALTLAVAANLLQVSDDDVERRWAARALFLFWAWPVLLVPPMVRGIRELWNLADWGKR